MENTITPPTFFTFSVNCCELAIEIQFVGSGTGEGTGEGTYEYDGIGNEEGILDSLSQTLDHDYVDGYRYERA